MGVVYKAEDIKLGRKVALKFLLDEFSGNQQVLQRFQREARTTSALNHPHILTVYEVGEDKGTLFIATELVEGRSLLEDPARFTRVPRSHHPARTRIRTG